MGFSTKQAYKFVVTKKTRKTTKTKKKKNKQKNNARNKNQFNLLILFFGLFFWFLGFLVLCIFLLAPTEKPLSKYYKLFPTESSHWIQGLYHKEVHIYYAYFPFKYSRLLSRSRSLLLRLFVEIKAFITSYLDEALCFKEVNLSYKNLL